MNRSSKLTARGLIGFLVLSAAVVAALAGLWKFGIEELVDPYLPGTHAPDSEAERWEFVIACTVFALAAMALPSWRALRIVQEQLQSNRLAAAVFNSAPQPMVVCDAARVITKVNPAFAELTGWAEDHVVGKPISILKSDLQDEAFYDALGDALKTEGGWTGEVWNRRQGDDSPYAVWLSITSVRDEDGQTSELVGVLSDITWRKQREEMVLHQANHDPLTGLANRRLCMDRLHQILGAAAVGGDLVAVLFIDLDGFKQVNDNLGHAAGDELLKEVASRLAICARSGDLLSRLAGDEFVIVLHEVGGRGDAEHIAKRCLARLRPPFLVNGETAQIGASIGIAFYPDDAGDPQALLAAADGAMYQAKQRGRNTYASAGDATA